MAHRPLPHRRGLYAAALVAVLAFACLSSCSQRLGWGLVLWTAPEGRLPAGSVVPVYIKSNINHVYVVGSIDAKSKVELPLWQVEVFPSRKKASQEAAKYAKVASLYLVALRDGLPVRVTPTNNGTDRAYRLREGESVKILALAKGDEVRSGDAILAGDWYYVLAGDGTRGYVYSNTMRLFDESKESGAAPLVAAASSSSVKVDLFFSRQWRPAYFQEMNDSGRPDLDLFSARYGLFVDAIRRQVRLELPAASQVFRYDSITDEGGSFLFEGTTFRVKFLSERRLIADWTGAPFAAGAAAVAGGVNGLAPTVAAAAAVAAVAAAAAANNGGATKPGESPLVPSVAPIPAANPTVSAGATGRAEFVVLAFEMRDVIHTEELRRQRLLDAFISRGGDWSLLLAPPATILSEAPAAPTDAGQPPAEPPVPGANFSTAAQGAPSQVAQPSASRFLATGDGRFRWSRVGLVPPGYLPQGLALADAVGDVAFRLYLPASLRNDWEGVLSLRFDAVPGSDWVNFLWRVGADGLILAPVSEAANQEAASPSPLVPLRFTQARAR